MCILCVKSVMMVLCLMQPNGVWLELCAVICDDGGIDRNDISHFHHDNLPAISIYNLLQ